MTSTQSELSGITRRALIARGAGAALAGGLPPWLAPTRDPGRPRPSQYEALRALGRTRLRLPDSLPHPALATGTDTLPEIEHIVVLMLENHSYDNLFGMLGRRRGQRPRGDGFTLAADGLPAATNPTAGGRVQRAFHMPTTCQLPGKPSQEWVASHIQYANGRNDGFVVSPSGPVAMGYWDERDLPFTLDLARYFPIGDRWFCSLLGQTDPNRRFLLAGTAVGMTDDIGGSIGNLIPDANLVLPANGTICERLNQTGISWVDYYASFPTGATVELFPVLDAAEALNHTRPIAGFFADAAAGKLPAFSLLDPDYGHQSQENPQNIVVGESFLSDVVNTLARSPKWLKTLLVVVYDEHGGYYDHVPPPAALAPDAIPPLVKPGQSRYDGFTRYGFRVPAMLIGPYAKRDHVSHIVYDHTSILALLERKWNLPAMTFRDANANDLTDFLDRPAMAAGRPTFPELPALEAPGEDAITLRCSRTGPGEIPPQATAPRASPQLRLRDLGIDRRRRCLLVELRCSSGTLQDLQVELLRGRRRVASRRIARLTTASRDAVLRTGNHAPAPGRYTVVVRQQGRTLARRVIHVR